MDPSEEGSLGRRGADGNKAVACMQCHDFFSDLGKRSCIIVRLSSSDLTASQI